MPAELEPRRGVLVELDDKGPHGADHRAQGLLVELAYAAAGAVGQVVRSLAIHLGLAGSDEVHGAGDGAHDPSGVGQRDIEHLLEREGRVDCGGDRQQKRGPVSRTALVGQGGFQLTRGAALSHQGHGEQDEGNDEEDRHDQKDCREIQRLPPEGGLKLP